MSSKIYNDVKVSKKHAYSKKCSNKYEWWFGSRT